MTTKIDTEQLRAAFEAWASDQYNLNRIDGAYTSLRTQEAWYVWREARAALQSQPKTDPSEWMKQHEALMHRVSITAMVLGYGGTINGATAEQALENAEIALLDHARALQSQDREDAEEIAATLATALHFIPRSEEPELYDDIEGLCVQFTDHARRGEGGGE